MKIHGLSVIVVRSSSLDPISPATTPVSTRPRNIHPKTLAQEGLRVAGRDRGRRCRVLHQGARYCGEPMPLRATKRGEERTALDGEYDVLICGASFAGLAVARELAGSGARVADRRPLRDRRAPDVGLRGADRVARGDGRRGLDAADLRHAGRPHAPHAVDFRLPWTFSTFDYRELCGLLFEQCDADVRDGKGRGTTQRRHGRARVAKDDRSRSRRIAASSPPPSSSTRSAGSGCSPGTSTSRPTRRSRAGSRSTRTASSDELEIWIDRGYVPAGYAWSFPARDEVRIGVGSFDPRFHVKEPTVRLAEDLDSEAVRYQGNWIPHKLRPATADEDLLRRRLGRPLPAADRGGDPDRLLLRDRLRARAAAGGRGPRRRVRGALRALRRVLGRARVEVQVDASHPAPGPAGPAAAARRRAARDGAQELRRLVVRPLPADRAALVRAGVPGGPAARGLSSARRPGRPPPRKAGGPAPSSRGRSARSAGALAHPRARTPGAP